MLRGGGEGPTEGLGEALCHLEPPAQGEAEGGAEGLSTGWASLRVEVIFPREAANYSEAMDTIM